MFRMESIMENNITLTYLNNRQFDKITEYITEQFEINVNEVAQLLNVSREELEGYTGSPINNSLETKLCVLAEFARLGFDGRLKACAEALVNHTNSNAFSKLCGVDKSLLENPEKTLSLEEKYRLAVGLSFLASIYNIDMEAQREENLKKLLAQH